VQQVLISQENAGFTESPNQGIDKTVITLNVSKDPSLLLSIFWWLWAINAFLGLLL
jgi:hypothetical protein